MWSEFKFKDNEEVYFRIGVRAFKGRIQYSEFLPAITADREEAYHIIMDTGANVRSVATDIYREREDVIAATLAEIHKEYWPVVKQYYESIDELSELK